MECTFINCTWILDRIMNTYAGPVDMDVVPVCCSTTKYDRALFVHEATAFSPRLLSSYLNTSILTLPRGVYARIACSLRIRNSRINGSLLSDRERFVKVMKMGNPVSLAIKDCVCPMAVVVVTEQCRVDVCQIQSAIVL